MTTWSKWNFWEDFQNYIINLRNNLPEWVPIWVWFWVKTREDVEKILWWVVDFAIIWSELIKQHDEWWIKQLEKYLISII